MTVMGQIRPYHARCLWRLGATGVPQEADPIADKAGDLFYRAECRCETARSGLPQL
jgi:hypothetical protein